LPHSIGSDGADTPSDQFQAVLNAIPQVVWSGRADGAHDFYNDRWYEFTGAASGPSDGGSAGGGSVEDGVGWASMLHPDDRARAEAAWRHSLATGTPYEAECRLRHHSGTHRWTLCRALPVRAADGRIARWFGTCTDIHDLKLAEEQRELIARELSHRIKNIFTVVSSLITISLRGAPAARPFATAFRARIDALARAHDYVRPHGPDSRPDHAGQTVRGLIGKVLAAYEDENHARIMISGDDAAIGVTAATSLALVIHELATNAMKYGALSQPSGQVAIDCALVGEFHTIVWQEMGGPAVTQPPAHRGFGSVMSARALTAMLGASIEHDWREPGLVVRIRLPLGELTR
jgi:two-component sensor histidine kinase